MLEVMTNLSPSAASVPRGKPIAAHASVVYADVYVRDNEPASVATRRRLCKRSTKVGHMTGALRHREAIRMVFVRIAADQLDVRHHLDAHAEIVQTRHVEHAVRALAAVLSASRRIARTGL